MQETIKSHLRSSIESGIEARYRSRSESPAARFSSNARSRVVIKVWYSANEILGAKLLPINLKFKLESDSTNNSVFPIGQYQVQTNAVQTGSMTYGV